MGKYWYLYSKNRERLYTSENIPVAMIKHQDVFSSLLQHMVERIAGRQIAMYLHHYIEVNGIMIS